MGRDGRIQVGKATNLHYGVSRRSRAHGQSPHAAPGPHIRRAPAGTGHGGPHRPRRPRRSITPALACALIALLMVVAIGGWYFTLRDVTVTVNGQAVAARVNTPLSEFLDIHEQFGALPGRLLSVSGAVLDENGGNPSTVTYGGEQLSSEQIGEVRLQDGDALTVENGSDAEEASTEETVAMEPSIQMEKGGAVQYVSQWGKAGKKRVKTGEVSGETVDVEVLEQPVDMVVTSINLKPQDGKYVALTFDDGPSRYTPEILSILKEKGVKATFFNLGGEAQSDPAGCKAIVDEGHELASHTMSHLNLPTSDRETLRSEISDAADALEEASGKRVQMIRAPYGAFTETEWLGASDLISCNVLWNIDTLDWKRPGAGTIESAALRGVKNGSIILMHDGGGNREQTVAALPGIIDGLQANGYQIVTVSELMRLDGRLPEDVVNGTVSKPE